MVLTSKKRLKPDIWPETLEQAKFIEDMIRSIWGKQAHWQYNAIGTKSCLLSLSGKEVRFVGPSYYYGHLVAN